MLNLDQRQIGGYGLPMAYDGRAVANLLLDQADTLGLQLTHMAIHKIAYFGHGWHLAQFGVPLIKQPFEAWRHGPVIQSVWEAFKQVKGGAVRGRAMRFDPVERTLSIAVEKFSSDTQAFVFDILRGYGAVRPLELSRLTHRFGGPWHRVWHAPAGTVTLGMEIPNDWIRDEFLKEAEIAARGRA